MMKWSNALLFWSRRTLDGVEGWEVRGRGEEPLTRRENVDCSTVYFP